MMVFIDVADVIAVKAASEQSFAGAITQVPLQYYVFPPNDTEGITFYHDVHDKDALNPQQPKAPSSQT